MQGKAKPEKMITFLDSLHQKYPVLTKLTQKQLSEFQNEVIMLLVDENENVDIRLYKDVVHSIGLDAFVLDVLSKSINRSPFSNQYEMKKNISSIAEQLQIQAKQCNKRLKIIERKQAQVSNRQINLKNKVKEYTTQLERDLINKLIAKQGEIKKNVSLLINNLKGKEKLLMDRKQQNNKRMQEIIVKQKNLCLLQKQLERKYQGQQSEAGQNLNQQNKVDGKLKQVKQARQINKKYEQLQLQVQKLRKKNKTTDMAYSKLKNDLLEKDKQLQSMKDMLSAANEKLKQEKQKYEKQRQIEEKRKTYEIEIKQDKEKMKNKKTLQRGKQIDTKFETQQKDRKKQLKASHDQDRKNFRINQVDDEQAQNSKQFTHQENETSVNPKKGELVNMLDLLDLSEIQSQCAHQDGQYANKIDQKKQAIHHKISSKLVTNKNQKIKENKTEVLEDQQNILFFNNYFSKSKIKNSNTGSDMKTQKLNSSKSQNLNRVQNNSYSSVINQSYNHLGFMSQDQLSSSPQQILQQIQEILSSQSSNKQNQQVLQSNLLLKFIKVPSYSLNKQVLSQYYDILLNLIQQSNIFYYESIQYLSRSQFCDFFQNSYLNYQSSLEIIQAATLLLSRIIMATSIQVKFKEEFIKAIKMRIKYGQSHRHEGNVEQSDSEQFLQANINCILSMVHV